MIRMKLPFFSPFSLLFKVIDSIPHPHYHLVVKTQMLFESVDLYSVM